MGYYTRFNLSVVKGDFSLKDLQEYISNDEEMEYALGESFGEDEEPRKWYSHPEDMKKMSLNFPNTLFLLEGEGEESGDVWKKYYLNGKCQKCYAQLVFEEFDENKLVDIDE